MSAILLDPAQSRSAETVAIFEAVALEHLREVGVRKFSTAFVAKRAGYTVGTIYRYWPTAEALIEAVAPGACRAWEVLAKIDPDKIETAIALAFEGEGEAWSDKLSGDRLARVARDAIEAMLS